MTTNLKPEALSDLRVFDVAKGVLIGARRCTVDEAFAELVASAGQHQVGVFALSRALVALSTRSEQVADVEAAIARTVWRDLFADPASDA